MRMWILTAGLGLLCVARVVIMLVREPGVDLVNPEIFGSALGLTLMIVATVPLLYHDLLNMRLDRNGPVAPSEGPAIRTAQRWSLEEVASVLAQKVEPMNGVVFADRWTRTIRVMIDPPSAIVESHSAPTRVGERSSRSIQGRWIKIRMRPGRIPLVKVKETSVSARIDSGRMLPRWADPWSRHSATSTMAIVAAAQRTPISFQFDSREFVPAIDRIAVQAGWVEVANREDDPKARHEVRVVARTGTTTETRTSMRTGDQPPKSTRHTTGTAEKSANSNIYRTHSDILESQSRPHDGQPGSAGTEFTWTQPPLRLQGTNGNSVKILTVIGAGVLVACVLGTVFGLIAGMPWWASFIVMGGGLLFCLIFVLPLWILAGPPWRPKSTDTRRKRNWP